MKRGGGKIGRNLVRALGGPRVVKSEVEKSETLGMWRKKRTGCDISPRESRGRGGCDVRVRVVHERERAAGRCGDTFSLTLFIPPPPPASLTNRHHVGSGAAHVLVDTGGVVDDGTFSRHCCGCVWMRGTFMYVLRVVRF